MSQFVLTISKMYDIINHNELSVINNSNKVVHILQNYIIKFVR